MNKINTFDFSNYLLSEFVSAGVLNESTVKLHNSKALFEAKIENTPDVHTIGGVPVSWHDFEDKYFDYQRYPTRDNVLNALGVHQTMFTTQDAYEKASTRLVKHWLTYRNPDAMKLAEKFGGSFPSFKDRRKTLNVLDGNGDFDPTLKDIDYGKRGKIRKGAKTINMLNNQEVVPGTFYNDVSRIPKHRYTGWLRLWAKFVKLVKIKKYFGKTWKKTFIMGYAFSPKSVVEVWYDSATSTFSTYDYNGVELGRPTATLQESTRLFVTFLLRQYETDNNVFRRNSNVVSSSYLSAISNAVNKTSIEVQREAELRNAESRKTRDERGMPVKRTKAPVRTSQTGNGEGNDDEGDTSASGSRGPKSGGPSGQSGGGSGASPHSDEWDSNDVRGEFDARSKAASKWRSDAAERFKTAANKVGAHVQNRVNGWDEVDPSTYTQAQRRANDARASAERFTQYADSQAGGIGRSPSAPAVGQSSGATGIGQSRQQSVVAGVADGRGMEPIQLPDMRQARAPKLDGLNDYERRMAVELYTKYRKKLEATKSDIEEFNREVRTVGELVKQQPKLGSIAGGAIEKRVRGVKEKRHAIKMSADEIAQFEDDLAELESRVAPVLKKRQEEAARKLSQANAEIAQERAAKRVSHSRKGNQKLKENFSASGYDHTGILGIANEMDSSQRSHREAPQSYGPENAQLITNIAAISSKESDAAAISRRKMAQTSGFTTTAIKTSVVEELITTYDVSRAGKHLKQVGYFSRGLLGDQKMGWFKKLINSIKYGREQRIELPTDKPVWYDRVMQVVRGVMFRADFVIGFSLKDAIDIEIWYVTEPDPSNPSRNISSYYIYDVTAGLIVRRNLPYYRNAIQTVLAKIGVE